MKKSFSLVILIIMFNVCLCQNIWQGGYNNFIRIEIQSGMSSIRLLKEGLLCVAIGYPPKYKLYTEFFPFKKLDFEKIVIIQNFLLNCSLLYKDAVIDNPNIGSTGHDKVFLIIKDDIFNRIIWVDGDCDELKTCILLLNDLIPKKKRELYRLGTM